jgi:hypothetical protein
MSSKGRAREGLIFGASSVFVSSQLLLAAGLFRSAGSGLSPFPFCLPRGRLGWGCSLIEPSPKRLIHFV